MRLFTCTGKVVILLKNTLFGTFPYTTNCTHSLVHDSSFIEPAYFYETANFKLVLSTSTESLKVLKCTASSWVSNHHQQPLNFWWPKKNGWNLLGFWSHMFEWCFICIHRLWHLAPPSFKICDSFHEWMSFNSHLEKKISVVHSDRSVFYLKSTVLSEVGTTEGVGERQEKKIRRWHNTEMGPIRGMILKPRIENQQHTTVRHKG